MKNKPKNAFKIALATFLGLSVACVSFVGFKPILSRADRIDGTVVDPADDVQDSGVTFKSSIFDYYEFEVNMSVTLDNTGILDNRLSFVSDFVPMLPVSRTSTIPDSYSNWSNLTYIEDTPSIMCYSNHGFNFGDVPPYVPDDDISDDEVTDVTSTAYHRMDNIAGIPDPNGYIAIGKTSESAIYCNDLPDLLSSLQNMNFIRFGFNGSDDPFLERADFYLSYLYFDDDSQLRLGSASRLDYLSRDDLLSFPDLGNFNAPDECFLLDCYIGLEVNIGQSNDFELYYDILFHYPMDYIHYGNDSQLLDLYIKANQTAVEYNIPAPTEVLFNPIEVFLKTEFIEGFSFGTLLLVSLGFLAFWLFLKVFVGG